MDLIQTGLEREKLGIDVLRYDGSMDMKKRVAAIDAFNVDRDLDGAVPKVLIVSLKVRAYGLFLNEALA